jgi:hypothetical protein
LNANQAKARCVFPLFHEFHKGVSMIVRTFLLVSLLCSLVVGQSRFVANEYARIELNAIAAHPADYQGRRVQVTADVVSIGADFQSLKVFDAENKSLVLISLAQLPKSQRRMLINGPVTRITVWGMSDVRNGRVTIRADKVSAITPDTLAGQ